MVVGPDRPRCVVCDKPVDEVAIFHDTWAHMGYHVYVKCHGETESNFIPEVVCTEQEYLQWGDAFQPKLEASDIRTPLVYPMPAAG